MSLLPLQIILGFQVTAAVVIFIQLMAGDEESRVVRVQKVQRRVNERVDNRS